MKSMSENFDVGDRDIDQYSMFNDNININNFAVLLTGRIIFQIIIVHYSDW